MLLYLNASWAGFLLESSLHYQQTLNHNSYALANLGSAYPKVSDAKTDEQSAVESKCNLWI